MDLTGVRGRDPVDVATQRREAAVIAPVVSREDGLALLFTKRADHLGEHPGQMSFPGGGREPEDASLRETALREANEEIGLRPHEADVHGCLDDIDTVTDYAVRPFVASIPDRDYVPDDTEVAEISVLQVSALTDADNYEAAFYERSEQAQYRLHFFRVDGYTVWGATGRMLVQLLELTTDWQPSTEVDRTIDSEDDLPG